MGSLNGHTDVVTTLLSSGADVNLTLKVKYHAALFITISIIVLFMQNGTKPIDVARSQGHSDIVCMLEKSTM